MESPTGDLGVLVSFGGTNLTAEPIFLFKGVLCVFPIARNIVPCFRYECRQNCSCFINRRGRDNSKKYPENEIEPWALLLPWLDLSCALFLSICSALHPMKIDKMIIYRNVVYNTFAPLVRCMFLAVKRCSSWRNGHGNSTGGVPRDVGALRHPGDRPSHRRSLPGDALQRGSMCVSRGGNRKCILISIGLN